MTQSEQILKSCVETVVKLRSALAAAKNQPPPDPQAAATFDRFVRVLSFLDARLQATDSAVAQLAILQQLANQLNAMLTTFNAFLQSAAQWQQLNNQIDQLLASLVHLPTVAAATAASQYTTTLADFLELRDRAIRQAEDRAAKMEDRVKALDSSVAAVDARGKEIQGQVNQEKSRLDQLIIASQGQIAKLVQDEQLRFGDAEKQRAKITTEGEAKRDAEHKARLAELSTKFDQMVAVNQKTISELIEASRKTAEVALADLSTQLKEAEQIVGLIANTGMAGHYQKEANVDWWSMWILRSVATGFFIGAICAIHLLIKAVHASQVDWEMVVFRFALVAVVLIPAFYFARESALHMRREARNRRIELELSALQPFIARLPEKEAQEIIKKKADQYFGQEPQEGQEEANLLRNVSLRGDQVLKILTKVLAAWKGK